jgi:hypothetical protein
MNCCPMSSKESSSKTASASPKPPPNSTNPSTRFDNSSSVDPYGLYYFFASYIYSHNHASVGIDPTGLKCVLCKWDGPFLSGKVDDFDKDVAKPVHRNGIDAAIKRMGEYLRNEMPLQDEYGPFAVDLRERMPPSNHVVTAGCLSVRMYLCGDSCVINLDEEISDYYWDPKARKWVEFRNSAPTYRFRRPDDNFIFETRLKEPKADTCDTVYLLTDCPMILQSMKMPPDDKPEYRLRIVKQTITVEDPVSSDKGRLMHSFFVRGRVRDGKVESVFNCTF